MGAHLFVQMFGWSFCAGDSAGNGVGQGVGGGGAGACILFSEGVTVAAAEAVQIFVCVYHLLSSSVGVASASVGASASEVPSVSELASVSEVASSALMSDPVWRRGWRRCRG